MSTSRPGQDSTHTDPPRPSDRESGPKNGAAGWTVHSSRQLLTIDQLSEWLQVPKQTVYKWRSNGAGPRGLRIGKYVRFEVSEVERWLAAQEEC
jgi:excisionase family DNA binding protein